MRFYGQFDPPVDRFIFERYFPETGIDGVFVECGAFDGLTECSCKFFEETLGWKGYNLEPVPWIYEKLCENRPGSKNINAGLSDTAGKGSFKAAIHPVLGRAFGNGSLKHGKSHLEQLNEMGCEFEDIEVDLITWKEFTAKHDIRFVDLFVLDVEGYELHVIEGMKGASVLPDVMCVEYGHLGLTAVREALDGLGYVYDITSNANAFFIKKDKAALFAARMKSGRDAGMAAEVKRLADENAQLKTQLDAVTKLYQNVTASKAWKFIEFLRKLKGGN